MPSDKHNSKKKRLRLQALFLHWSTSLYPEIYLFYQLQQLHCLHHLTTFVLFCAPVLLFMATLGTIYGRHIMASVWDIKTESIAEHFSHYSLLLMLYKAFSMPEMEMLWPLCIQVWAMGHPFHLRIFLIFHDSWMDSRDALHAALCLCYCEHSWVLSKLAYGLPLINSWGTCYLYIVLDTLLPYIINSCYHPWV